VFSTILSADSLEPKLKEFEKTLEEFAKVKALVDENGEYQLLIEKARNKNLEKANEFLAIVSDSKKSQYQRKASLEKLFKFEDTISQLDKTNKRLAEISSAISARTETLEFDKKFFLQMIAVNDHESANKALDSINGHMNFLIDVLDELGDINQSPNSEGDCP
jgi:chromosome segregation ATPase